MKTRIFLILIFLNVFFSLHAQTGTAGNEKYNSYEQCVYIDNLSPKLTSEIFINTYYSKLTVSDYKNSQIIDTVHHKRGVYIRTKKAKEGFLFVNRNIMNKFTSLNCDLGNMKILYVYNNKIATTKKDVMRVIKLREKNIQISEILQDEKSGIITVYIFDK